MPSKQRNKYKRKHEWYQENAETVKCKASAQYSANKDILNSQRNEALQNDDTFKKHKRERSKQKWDNDDLYKEAQKATAKVNTNRRLEDNPVYKDINRARARVNTKSRLEQDTDYKLYHSAVKYTRRHLGSHKLSASPLTTKNLLHNRQRICFIIGVLQLYRRAVYE
jgi:hypothetical protein